MKYCSPLSDLRMKPLIPVLGADCGLTVCPLAVEDGPSGVTTTANTQSNARRAALRIYAN